MNEHNQMVAERTPEPSSHTHTSENLRHTHTNCERDTIKSNAPATLEPLLHPRLLLKGHHRSWLVRNPLADRVWLDVTVRETERNEGDASVACLQQQVIGFSLFHSQDRRHKLCLN